MTEETENQGGREAYRQDEARSRGGILDELGAKPAIRAPRAVGGMGKERHRDLHISL
jgi:hypothetical protein